MTAKDKAVTAEKLARHLQDADDLEAVKTCSKCGRLFVFYASKGSCPACGEGKLHPLSRYLPVAEA